MKYIILCADDYGQNAAISSGIIALLQQKRLNAVSCLTTFHPWEKCSKALLPFINKVDIGIHLNFTEGHSLTQKKFTSLPWLILQSYLRVADKKLIYREICAQLDKFTENLGILPDFIDGHQHIHQLPVIRDIILKIYHERRYTCYFRSTYGVAKNSLKAFYIQSILAKSFKSQLLSASIPHNTSFAGIYHFHSKKNYQTAFCQFLAQVNGGGLIMCHPGFLSADDQISEARREEYDYFSSDQFINDLGHYETSLTRMKCLYTPE